jgi:hypothetical protein
MISDIVARAAKPTLRLCDAKRSQSWNAHRLCVSVTIGSKRRRYSAFASTQMACPSMGWQRYTSARIRSRKKMKQVGVKMVTAMRYDSVFATSCIAFSPYESANWEMTTVRMKKIVRARYSLNIDASVASMSMFAKRCVFPTVSSNSERLSWA